VKTTVGNNDTAFSWPVSCTRTVLDLAWRLSPAGILCRAILPADYLFREWPGHFGATYSQARRESTALRKAGRRSIHYSTTRSLKNIGSAFGGKWWS